MRIGYGRVSTRDQNLEAQADALASAAVDRFFVEKITGTKADRPELLAAMDTLRAGDTLVVTRLDRLGRSTKDLLTLAAEVEAKGANLEVLEQKIDTSSPEGRLFFRMIASFAEFEHDIMVGRTMDGLAAARARGRQGGRKAKLTERQIRDIRAKVLIEHQSIKNVADDYKVSRPTIYRALEGADAQ